MGTFTEDRQNSNTNFRKVQAMGVLGPRRHTQKTGDITEYAAITRLLECGYGVLTPVGQMHRYDLVIEDADGRLWRVQCKKGGRKGEKSKIMFSVASARRYIEKRKK